jgi:hypothetical protein
MKMKRRKGQAKKKARLKRRAGERKTATAQPGKKAPRRAAKAVVAAPGLASPTPAVSSETPNS